jgi:hypothetical protein
MRKLLLSISVLLIALGLLGCSFFYSLFQTPTATPFPESTSISEPTSIATLAATAVSTLEATAIPTEPAQKLPQLTGNWRIRLEQTGGFAGVSRSLEISSSGQMTIIEERINKNSTTQLPADKLAKLKELVASSEYHPVKQPMGCSDCFIFNLQIDNGSEKEFQMQIDQVNLPDTGLEPLVGFLGEMLNSK